MRSISSRMSFCSLKRFPKASLLRFVQVDSRVVYDEKQNLKGRGAYLLAEEIPLALKKNAFAKVFKKSLSKEEMEAIQEVYERYRKA
jgi:predicted RNA-binding protein YlxR (DUF448 family)